MRLKMAGFSRVLMMINVFCPFACWAKSRSRAQTTRDPLGRSIMQAEMPQPYSQLSLPGSLAHRLNRNSHSSCIHGRFIRTLRQETVSRTLSPPPPLGPFVLLLNSRLRDLVQYERWSEVLDSLGSSRGRRERQVHAHLRVNRVIPTRPRPSSSSFGLMHGQRKLV